MLKNLSRLTAPGVNEPAPSLEHAIVHLDDVTTTIGRVRASITEQRQINDIVVSIEQFGASPALIAAFNRKGTLTAIDASIPGCESLRSDARINPTQLLATMKSADVVATEGLLDVMQKYRKTTAVMLTLFLGPLVGLGAYFVLKAMSKSEKKDDFVPYGEVKQVMDAIHAAPKALQDAARLPIPDDEKGMEQFAAKLGQLGKPLEAIGLIVDVEGQECYGKDNWPEPKEHVQLNSVGYKDGSLAELAHSLDDAGKQMKSAAAAIGSSIEKGYKDLEAAKDDEKLSKDERFVKTQAYGMLVEFLTSAQKRAARGAAWMEWRLHELKPYYE